MPEESLTYRSSGVDIDANAEANERLKQLALRTHNSNVISRPGLFGGVVRLDTEGYRQPALVGSLGYIEDPSGSPADTAERVWQVCRRGSAGQDPVAFLDYVATETLEPETVESVVSRFCRYLGKEKIPLLGGETAEMPGTFFSGSWEIVGALFGLRESGDRSSDPPQFRTLTDFEELHEPLLVLSIDGVGTKTKIGILGQHCAGLAEDIIHHSLNDILCQGARGTAVMIYIGCHKRGPMIEAVLKSVDERCSALDLALLDQVVVEKPDTYPPGELDICGAVAGLTDARRVIQGAGIRAGDRLIGLASSGLHTNGYSLARRALLDRAGYSLERQFEALGTTLGEALLEPHRNYAPTVLPLIAAENASGIKGIAHVTGGGLAENLVRILPQRLGAEIDTDRWTVPPIFRLIQDAGGVPDHDPVGKGMYETFNMGIGLVLAVDCGQTAGLLGRLNRAGEQAFDLGCIVTRAGFGVERVLWL